MNITELMPVIIIMALIIFVLPVVIGRATGKNPLEVFFGKHITNHLSFGSGADAKGGAQGASAAAGKKTKKERNSTGQELMETISAMVNYARRNHYYCVVPGTVEADGEMAILSAILVTKSSVIGIHCFGYGGTVYFEGRQEKWRQVLNGETVRIDSPVLKNDKQKQILEKVVRKCREEGTDVEVLGVFTAKGVTLKNSNGTRCYPREALTEILGSQRYTQDKGIDPKKLGKELEAYVKRTDAQDNRKKK